MNQQHLTRKCPFWKTLITRDFCCEQALDVTHRDGPGVVCQQENAHQRCMTMFAAMKVAALPGFGVADDLTEMPASVSAKIQYGGLLALSAMLGRNNSKIANVNALLVSVNGQYERLEDIDFVLISKKIKDFRLQKRRNR